MSTLSSTGPSQILPFLYVGCQEDASSNQTMQGIHITHVINVSVTGDRAPFLHENDHEHFLRIPINDSLNAQLLPYFDQAYEFIEQARLNNGRVFIHCLAGISRSPALAIAFVMRCMHLSVDDAYNYVKQRRSQISPNFNFMGQLSVYERNLSITSKSTPMVKCVAIEPPLNDRRRCVQLEGCSNTDHSIKSREQNLSHPQTLFSTNDLSSACSSQESFSKPKMKRPNNIPLEHPRSELNNSHCDGIKDKKASEIVSKSADTSSSTKKSTELINTYFQTSNHSKSSEEWTSAPLLESDAETATSNILNSNCELFVS